MDTREFTEHVVRLQSAEQLLAEGNAHDALALLEASLGLQRPDPWVLAGLASAMLGDYPSVPPLVHQAENLARDGFVAPHREASLAQLRGFVRAWRVVVGLSDGFSDDERAVAAPLERAAEALDGGDPPRAIRMLLLFLSRTPMAPTAWTDLGICLLEAGRAEQAVEALTVACLQGPEERAPHLMLARAEATQGRLGQAAIHLRDLLALDPRDEEALGLLAALGVVSDQPLASPPAPELSVIVPAYVRPRKLLNLLDHIAVQDLSPDRFEVIVVDDGSPTPLSESLGPQSRPFALEILRKENGGPGPARNLGVERARGRFVLFFNDDTLPAPDVLRLHLEGQLARSEPAAILGTFQFPPSMLQSLFMQAIESSDLLFQYNRMRPGELNPWQFFYTCNISLERAALLAVGGFDPELRWPLIEDSELGYRLEKELGLQVLYAPEIRSTHDHIGGEAAAAEAGALGVLEREQPGLDVRRYARRQERLGALSYLLWKKHGDAAWLHEAPHFVPTPAFWERLAQFNRDRAASYDQLLEQIDRLDQRPLPQEAEELSRVTELLVDQLRALSAGMFRRGMLKGLAEFGP